MADISRFVVEGEAAGMRLDIELKNQFPEHSRAHYQRAIRDGFVSVDGNVITVPRFELAEGMQVELVIPASPATHLRGEDIDLDVIYEDEDMLVINKAPGMVVHPGAGNYEGTLVNALLNYDQEKFGSMVNDELRPGIVHRLDKDTSGILVIGKNENAVANLSASFKARETRKMYLAIVHGFMEEPLGKIVNLIGRSPHNRKKMAVVTRNGKEAISRYQMVAYNNNTSLVRVGIETGRTHQIRVHMSSIKHPIVGDEMYGGKQAFSHLNAERQMLHAWRLKIPHPTTKKMMKFEAPLPEDFLDTLEQAGINLVSEDEFNTSGGATRQFPEDGESNGVEVYYVP